MGKFNVQISDSTLHALVQRRGRQALEQAQERTQFLIAPQTRGQAMAPYVRVGAQKPFSLILMMDAWKARYRGENWGSDSKRKLEDHCQWKDIKSAVIYRLDHHVQKEGGRGLISQKNVVSYQGEPEEFGRQVHADALRRGLAQAQQVFVVADGAIWIWNIAQDRFKQATFVLDYYHACQHLWAVADELFGQERRAEAKAWVDPLLKQTKAGQVVKVIGKLEELPGWCSKHGEAIPPKLATELEYFKTNQPRMNYKRVKQQGAPIGSGAMESLCSQFQGRFKRTGQFWTSPGFDNLMALEVARRNNDWNQIWTRN